MIMATFSNTVTINTFAVKQGLTKIDILKNPKTGKRFGSTDTGVTLRVADNVVNLSDDLSVSWFSPDDGDASWMLHKTGQGAELISSLSFAPAKTLAQDF